MARNALMGGFVMPQFSTPDIGNLIEPIQQGIQRGEQRRQQTFQNERALAADSRDQKRLSMAQTEFDEQVKERRFKKLGHALNQGVILEPDDAKAMANFQHLATTVPGFAEDAAKYGLPLDSPRLAARMVASSAGVLQDPLERERSMLQNRVLRRNLDQPIDDGSKIMEVNGQIYRVPRQGNAQPIGGIPTSEKGVLTELDPGKTLMYTNPRTGETRVLREPQQGPTGLYKDMKQRADVEEGLRKEVTAAAKDYSTIRESATALDAISRAPSAASDIAMVFSFMKILDPGSVVRETEYATAAQAAGVPERVVGIIQRIQNGQFLTPQQRAEFLSVAKTMADAREQSYRQNLQRYEGISQRIGVDPRNVLPEPAAPSRTAPQGAPDAVPPGEYVFDPATGQLRRK
jgi:hypothetical protein